MTRCPHNWPAAPSRLPFFHPALKDLRTRELTRGEIARLVEAYGYAAGIAKRAGFDALYIHAHSYLIDQFLSSCWNQRNDEYGGTLENRMRFLLQCLESARRSVGREFPIILGLGLEHGFEGGRKIEESIEIAKRLEKEGIHALHLREGSYDAMAQTMPNAYMEDGPSIPNAVKVKQAVGLPVIVDGGLGDPDLGETLLAENKVDFVGLARPLLADPEWPRKVRAGKKEEIRPCIRCMECLTRNMLGKFIGCSVNPRAGREREPLPAPAWEKKKVLVIGGGPGGMEAARLAARRGHEVTLLEREPMLGGHLVEACVPSFKRLLGEYQGWMERQLRASGAKVETGVEGTAALVEKISPDAVILGSGSVPLTPDVPGIGGKNVIQAVDYLRGKCKTGSKVVIIGGGLVGGEASLCLAATVEGVTIVEMLSDILMDVSVFSKFTMMAKMRGAGVQWVTSQKLREVKENGVVIDDPSGKESFLPADTVILATGFRANDQLYGLLDARGYEVYRIGDCQSPRKIIDAVRDGYTIAKDL
jgi:2-enoate reductase